MTYSIHWVIYWTITYWVLISGIYWAGHGWKHFETHYYKTGAQGKQYRLVKNLKLALISFDPEQSHSSGESKQLKSPVSVPRKSPMKRVYQQDQFKLFEEQDRIKSFDDIDSTVYTFQKYDDHVIFLLKNISWNLSLNLG